MKVLRFDLKKALNNYEARTGLRLSYGDLSQITGVSINTIKSLATREKYNATLQLISQIANALDINPTGYFEWTDDEK